MGLICYRTKPYKHDPQTNQHTPFCVWMGRQSQREKTKNQRLVAACLLA